MGNGTRQMTKLKSLKQSLLYPVTKQSTYEEPMKSMALCHIVKKKQKNCCISVFGGILNGICLRPTGLVFTWEILLEVLLENSPGRN